MRLTVQHDYANHLDRFIVCDQASIDAIYRYELHDGDYHEIVYEVWMRRGQMHTISGSYASPELIALYEQWKERDGE